MAPRTVYANLQDGLQNLSLWDQSLADMGSLGIIPCTAAGTNTVVLTPIANAFAPNVSSPPNQLQAFSFVAAATSTGSVTVNGLKLYKEDAASQAGANDIIVNVLYGVVYNAALNGAAGGYQIVFPVTSIINPVITGATISNSTITTSTYNGNTWTAGTGTLTLGTGKTLNATNSLTLSGTDGTVMTFPTTSATLARTDTGQTFTGTNAFGVMTATTFNGNTLTAGTWTLTGTAAKTLTFNNSITLAGTDATTMTFPTTSATLARTDAGNTFTGNQAFSSLTASSAVATDGSKNLVSVTNTGSGNNVLATSPTLVTPTLGAASATSLQFTNTAGLIGSSTNDNANNGSVGEYPTSNIVQASAVSLTTATTANITSLSLTAGDWDVWGQIAFNIAATTNVTFLDGGLATTSASFPNFTDASVVSQVNFPGGSVLNSPAYSIPSIRTRFSLSTTTTIYLLAQATFTVSTCKAYGFLAARRLR